MSEETRLRISNIVVCSVYSEISVCMEGSYNNRPMIIDIVECQFGRSLSNKRIRGVPSVLHTR